MGTDFRKSAAASLTERSWAPVRGKGRAAVKASMSCFAPPAPEEGQAQGEAEELLEHQPPPGPGQGLPVRGEVDLPIGEGGGGQVIGPAEVVGQGL